MNTTIKDTGFVAQRESAAAKVERHSPGLRNPPGSGGVEEAARREFDRLYREGKENDGGAGENQQENPQESLSSLMSSLFGERMGASASPTQAAPVEASRAAEMVERLVAQILVSPPDSAGEQEVRLMVKDSLLPDTEIRLARGADGLLSVTLSTGRSEVFQTLVAAQADLKQALDAREKQEVRLVVVDTQKSGAEDENSERRSRGYSAYALDDGEAG